MTSEEVRLTLVLHVGDEGMDMMLIALPVSSAIDDQKVPLLEELRRVAAESS